MPRVDSITGCTVMTNQEFWEHEAEHEGKGREPYELQQEMYDDMDASIANEENRYKDPLVALVALNEMAKEWNEGVDEEDRDKVCFEGAFVEVLEVEAVNCRQSFRNSGMDLTARCRMIDGSVRRIMVTSYYSGGSFYEPPDYGIEFKVLE